MFRATRVPVVALIVNLKDGVSVNEFVELIPGLDLVHAWSILSHIAKISEMTNFGYQD